MRLSPNPSHGLFRVLVVSLLSFALLTMPFAPAMAASVSRATSSSPTKKEAKNESKLSSDAATESYLFVNQPIPQPAAAVETVSQPAADTTSQPAAQPFWKAAAFLLPAGSVTATMTGTLAPADDVNSDGNVDPGDKITYTVQLGNTTGTDATGLIFTDTVDSHTTLDNTSINSTPVAFDQSVSTDEDTQKAITLTGQDADGNSITFVNVPSVTAHGTLSGTAPNLTYTPAADYNGPDSFTFKVRDSKNADSNETGTISITVNAVNDAPCFAATASPCTPALPGTQTFNEDTTRTFNTANSNRIRVSDVDSGANNVTFTASVSHGTINVPTVGVSVTNNNTANVTVNGTVANIDSAINGMSYTPAANYNGSDTLSLNINDNGNTGSGGALSASGTVTLTITAVNDKPVVTPPAAFAVHANMKRTGLTGLLANVTDPDTGTGSPACNPTFTVASVSATTPAGGTISNLNTATGTFDFDPPAGFTGGDVTFTYTVSDNGCPGSATSDPATVTVSVSGPVIWFVDTSLASNGNGTLSNTSSPAGIGAFNNLLSATTAMGANANQRIFVYKGSGSTASGTGVTLQASQWLIGQGAIDASNSFDTLMGLTVPANTIARPGISNSAATSTTNRPTIQGTVNMNGSNTRVQGINIQPPAGTRALVSSSSGAAYTNLQVGVSASQSDVTISATGTSGSSAMAADLNNTNGTFTFISINANQDASSNKPASAISLNNTNTTSGSFTVLGTGSAGSGGTLQNIQNNGLVANNSKNITLNYMNLTNAVTVDGGSGAGGGTCTLDVVSGCNAAIELNTVTGATLSNVVINGSAEQGILGTSVTNFSISNSTVQNAGNEAGENGVHFINLYGLVLVTNSTFTGSAFNNFGVTNTVAGTPLNMTVTGSTFSSNSSIGGDGLVIDTRGGTTSKIKISSNTFTANKDDHVNVVSSSNAVTDVTISGNTMSGGHASPTGQGIAVRVGGLFSGTFKFDIDNNTVNGAIPTAINTGFGSTTSTGVMHGTIRNNHVGTSGSNLSGSAQGSCILVEENGVGQSGSATPAGTYHALVDNNTLKQCFDKGIDILASRDGNSNMNVTVSNNNVNELTNASSRWAVRFETGSSNANETGSACVDIKSNTLNAQTIGDEISVRQRSLTPVSMPGCTTCVNNDANTQTYLVGRNTNGGPGGSTLSATVTHTLNTNFTNAGSQCTQPTLPSIPPTSSYQANKPEVYFAWLDNVSQDNGADSLFALLDVKSDFASIFEETNNYQQSTLTAPTPEETQTSWLAAAAEVVGGNGEYDNTASLAPADTTTHTIEVEQNSAHAGEQQATVPTIASVQTESSDIAPTSATSEAAQTDSVYVSRDNSADRDARTIKTSYQPPAEEPAVSAAQTTAATGEEVSLSHGSSVPAKQASYYARAFSMLTPFPSGETLTINGTGSGFTLPAACASCAPGVGKTITITFKVTVNNPPNLSQTNPAQVSNHGTLSGANVSAFDTNTVNTAIDRFDTTTTLSSTPTPWNTGQSITLTAAVASNPTGNPTAVGGTVTFKDGVNTVSGCSSVSVSAGQAQCNISSLASGAHSFQATYNGDGNFDPSNSNTISQSAAANSTTTTVTSSLNPSFVSQNVTFTATVTSTGNFTGSPTGTVAFKDGASTITCSNAGGQTLSSGVATCQTSALPAGNSHIITAVYTPADATFTTSNGALSAANGQNGNPQVVNKSDTTTVLTSSSNPVAPTVEVTYTATVSSQTSVTGPPTGTVTFKDGASTIVCTNAGGQTLSGGVATCKFTYPDTTGSPHDISAVYNGDDTGGRYNGSNSTHISETVASCSSSYVVTSTADDGSVGTLRYGITTGVCDGGTITFDPVAFASPGPYTINLSNANGELLVNKNVTITGPGASVLTVKRDSAATNKFRVFEIAAGKTVQISGMTISNGSVVGTDGAAGSGAVGGSVFGGGISNAGTLTLTNVIVSGNSATGGAGGSSATTPGNGGNASGGGIYNNGTLTLSNSTVASNTSTGGAGGANTGAGSPGNAGNGLGGGIYNDASASAAITAISGSTINSNTASVKGGGIYNTGTLTNAALALTNSTVSGNNANNDGGGIYNDGATGTTVLTSVTVTNNRADNDNNGSGNGGGIKVVTGTVTLKNTIVAGNFNEDGVTDTADDINGAVAGSFNLIGDGTGMTGIANATNNNQVGVADARLDALASNGGPTQTHALLTSGPASPAIDAGSDVLTTLSADITDTTSPKTITVADTSSIPAGVGFVIRIDAEQMVVTSKTSTTLTVTRGANGTTAATHLSNGGTTPVSLTTDQRGLPRPAGSAADIGAFETQPTPSAPGTPNLDDASDSGTNNQDNKTNITTNLSFTITPVTPGATVELFRDGNPIGTGVTGVAAGNSIQLVDPGTGLIFDNDGTDYVYTAKQSVGSGNTSPASTGLTVTITIVPDKPVLDPASDSGTPGDNITNDTSPTFNITNVVNGATVELLRDGNPIGAGVTGVAAGTTIQLTDPSAPEGTYSYSARQTFNSVTSVPSASQSVQITIKPNAPVLVAASDSGTVGDGITNDDSPTFSVTGIVVGAKVELFRDNGATAVDTIASAASTTVQLTDPGPVSEALHSYKVRQTVGITVSPDSDPTGVTIDKTIAPATPDLTDASDTGASTSDNRTGAPSRDFNISTTENGSTVVLLRRLATDPPGSESPVAGVNASKPGTGSSITLTDANVIPDGTYQYSTRETDKAGNVGTSSTLAVTIDTTPPSVASVVRASANPTAAGSVDFTVTFSEPVQVSGVDASDFAVTKTGGITGESINPAIVAVAPSGSPSVATQFTVTVNTGTGDGTLRLDVVDIDDSILDIMNLPLGGTNPGNGNFSAGQVYTISKSNPFVSSINRANPDPTNLATINFTVTFNKAVTGVDSGDFKIVASVGIAGAGFPVNPITTSDNIHYNVAVNTGSGDGTIGLNLDDDNSIVDSSNRPLGGAAAGDGNFTMGQVYTVDKTKPDVTVTGQADVTGPKATTVINFTVTFTEPVVGFSSSELTLSGTATGGGTVAEVSETGLLDRKTYNVAVKNMTGSGTVILSVGANKLTDDAGNFNNASTSPVDPNTDNTVNFTKDDFTTLVVNTIADTDDTSCDPLGTGTGNKDCTLREAINAANGDAGAEIITFDSTVFASPGPYTINLGSVLPDLSSSMTINGPGANVLLVKRNVSARFRIFTVTSGVTVNISGLTVTNGFTADGPTGLKADDGGGIFNAGTLTLTNVAVSGNKTGKGGDGSGGPGGPGGTGGGIYNDTGATLTVTNSTIGGTPGVDGNKTGNGGNATNPNNNGVGGDGGGIFNAGTLNLTNSTISGNQTGAAGTGGLGNAGGGGGGILNINSPLTISNSTITANTVGNGRGGGLRQAGSGVITIKSTIVGGNSATVGPDIDGTVQSDGFNLVQSTSGATINQNGGAGPNITGQDAQLNALADNGGPTKTHSLQCVSPAIDKGFNFGQTTDQRGLVRVFDFADSIYPNAASPGNGTDIGAYESQAGGGCIPDAIAPNPQPTTNEDTQKTITLTGQFSQNTTLVLTVTQQPSHGSLSNQSAPTCNFANNTNTCTATVNYTPALNYSGPDTFKFKASAGALDSAEADVNITVNAVNDPPVAFDNFSPVTNEDTPINITLFGSDVDTPAANLVFTVVTGPSHGTLSGTAPNLTYTPAADYFGGDSFTFKINDGQLDSNVATVGITVTAVNDRPQATSQVVSTNENTPKVITLTGIDVDTPPSNFGFIIVSGPSHGTLSPGTPNAVQTYTPNQNYNGPDSFTFKINDGQLESNSATVTINVIAVNDAPVANAQAVSTNEDTPLGITLTGTDTETPSSSLTFNVTQQPAHGTLTGTGPNRTYTPAADYNGPDSFKFTVTDTGDGSAAPLTSGEAVVSITVGAVNDAPINTVPGAQSVIENGTLTFSSVNLNPISTSDVDAGASSVMVTLTATNGKVTLSGTTGLNFITGTGTANAIMTFTGPITSVNTALNGLVFTPNQGFDGAASLQIVTNDQGNTGSGGPLADTDTINIAVLDGGALAFSSATYTVSETGGTATITVNRTGGTNGTATVNYATSNGTATAGQDYTAASGTLTFGPGVTTQTFTVPITNDNLTEGAETVNLTLSSIGGSGALGTPSTAILTITETAPLGPLVQLSSATYDVNEGAGRATITVNRSGDISQAASVHYATSDLAGLTPCATANGLASERCDYATVVGTLSFAANQSSKTILIPIVNDSYAEGPETFTITLSNFTGASAGAITSATITILDNDAVTGPNPIDTNQEFIQALYRDFLGREPDPPGLQGWLNTLNNCPAGSTSCDRVEVASGFARSEEFATRGYFIYRLYEGILGRMPQYNEFTVDMAGVSGFLSSQELETAKQAAIEALMQRPEFKTRYDSTLNDPAGFVNLLEQAARVTLPNKQALIADLQAGRKTRAQVIRAVIETSEVFNKYFNEALVVMNYFGFLRRSPDALFQHWLDLMNSTGDIRQVINGFVNSAEYRLRFGP